MNVALPWLPLPSTEIVIAMATHYLRPWTDEGMFGFVFPMLVSEGLIFWAVFKEIFQD